MKTKRKLIKYAALMVLLSTLNSQFSIYGQVTAFTYQGFLTDQGGPANGAYDLTATLFDAPSGGATVGPSNVFNNLALTNSLFTVTLNFGSAPFDGSGRWLELAVRPGASTGPYTNLTPRQQITATPYALRTLNFSGSVAASQLTGVISSNNIGAGSITTVMLATGAVGSNQLVAGAVTTATLADGAVTAPKVATVSNWFALTIANPTRAGGGGFGWSVAAVGSDRVLVGAAGDDTGATNSGAAYLFNTNGTLLTTFTNPTPATFDNFGYSVAAVGSDRVLIGALSDDTGAEDSGSAYLFSTNGTLLITFTNPTPAADDLFGGVVAGVGSGRVLIAAPLDDTGATNSGAAYLFSINGALLTTFTNPTPAFSDGDLFGGSVAVVGSDRVLIGARYDNTSAFHSGGAHLFSSNGTLLTTFTNPTPAFNDHFGYSVAAVGSDRVLIGAIEDDTGAMNAGAAYLFSTNGTLLTTFTNPSPASGDYFGFSVAAVGSDRVLIGTIEDDTGAAGAGAAYLFSTNGTLLTTFTNPTPANDDRFGNSVAALGSDRVLIGAPSDDTSATNAGAVYLFSTETFTDGLVADAVRARSVNTASLEDGAVTAAKIGGVLFPSQIPDLSASKITSGTLADARLSANVALRAGGNAFTGNQTVTGGNVGIGTNNPQDTLHVGGPYIRISGAGGEGAYLGGNGFANDVQLGSVNPTVTNVSLFNRTTSTYMDLVARRIQADQITVSNGTGVSISGPLRLNNSNLWLRAGSDVNHGLGWYGNDKPFAGASNVIDGPVLFGYTGGALGTEQFGAEKIALFWNSSGNVGIGTNNPQATLDVNGSMRLNSGTLFTNLQAGQTLMAGGASSSYTNLVITFPKAFLTTPKVVTTASGDPGFSVPDTFVTSVRATSTTSCTVNIVRVDSPTGWSQVLRINWIAWE